VPDIYWFDQDTEEWVLLEPSDGTDEWIEFTFNESTEPSLQDLFPELGGSSLGASVLEVTSYFAQTGSYPVGGSGGGGCSVGFFAPAAVLLLLPLLGLVGKR